jgi:hypothetical protein
VDKIVETILLDLLSYELGKESTLAITQGRNEHYLGMQIDYIN